MAVVAPSGPYEIKKTPPTASLIRLPGPPGPRGSPSLARPARGGGGGAPVGGTTTGPLGDLLAVATGILWAGGRRVGPSFHWKV